MASGTFKPTNNTDDGIWYSGGFDDSDSSLYLGNAGIAIHSFIRFTGVNIPQGSTIDACFLRFKSDGAYSGTVVDVDIHFADADNQAAPTSEGECNGLSLTGGIAFDGIGSWSNDVQYDSPELKTRLQTVVDRVGFASGNAIVAVVKDGGSSGSAYRACYDYGWSASDCVELHVTWTAGGGTTVVAEPFILVGSLAAGVATIDPIINPVFRFIFTLTGGADGLSDQVMPISSFSARLLSGNPTFLSVVIPGLDYSAQIADRPNGDLSIKMGFEVAGVIVLTEEIVRVDFENIQINEGAVNQSITLDGHRTETWSTKTIALTGASYRNLNKGKIRYRVVPDIYVKPGDTVEIGLDSFIIDNISLSMSGSQFNMEVAEA